jgi:uncharacterized protein YjdB
MKISKFNVTRILVSMALCCALMVGSLIVPGSVAEAATKKAAISATKMTIPIGKLDSKVYYYDNPWQRTNAQKLTVNNKVKGATYQFTSSNTKVVTISKDGGYLTGVKAGTATITCTQTYNKKKTTLGKCKVTVKSASLTVSDYGNEFAVGDGGFNLYSLYAYIDPLFSISYRNPKATYSLTSSSKDFTIKEVKYDASSAKDATDDKEGQSMLKDFIGDGYFYGYTFTAKKAGTYTITVKETYNKKTKTLGSFKVVIKDTSIYQPNVDLVLGDSLNVFSLISYTKANTNYYFNIENYDDVNPDNNAVALLMDGSELYLYGNKIGTAQVTVREGSESGTVIGTVTVTVSDAPCESIWLDSDESTAYVDDYFDIYFSVEPWNTTDTVTVESDNPDVLKVEYSEELESWIYSPLKAGEANITIKCGNQSAVCKVTVEEY